MDLKLLGKRLQYIRKSAGLSREYIERTYDIPAVTLRSWELLGPDIGIYKLTKYLEIYKDIGLNFSFDMLIDTNKDFSLKSDLLLSDEARFINSSLCKQLMQKAKHIFFYANQYKEIIYLSTSYLDLIASTNINIPTKYTITVDSIFPQEYYEKSLPAISQVLEGKIANIVYVINKDNVQTDIELSLLPNFDQYGSVMGFAAACNV